MTNTQPALQLYGFWRTSATYRVRVALAMKGLSAHEHIVDLDAGEQHSPAYRALNPLGGIPTLVQPGQPPLTQSLAILEFLEETQPDPPLLPAGPHARARVRSLACMLAADTHPLITPRVRKYLTTQGRFDHADWRAWQTQWFGAGLQAVEQRLARESATGLFCHGDAPTLADICLNSVIVVMQAFQIEVGPLPMIEGIVARCQTLEPFARARPDRQLGAPAPAG